MSCRQQPRVWFTVDRAEKAAQTAETCFCPMGPAGVWEWVPGSSSGMVRPGLPKMPDSGNAQTWAVPIEAGQQSPSPGLPDPLDRFKLELIP
jgi:hypothetical protein